MKRLKVFIINFAVLKRRTGKVDEELGRNDFPHRTMTTHKRAGNLHNIFNILHICFTVKDDTFASLDTSKKILQKHYLGTKVDTDGDRGLFSRAGHRTMPYIDI